MNAADRLAEIQARADKATTLVHQYVETGGEAYEVIVADRILQAARTDVVALITALEAVLAQCDRHESIGSFTDYEVGRKYVAGCVRRAVENTLEVAS